MCVCVCVCVCVWHVGSYVIWKVSCVWVSEWVWVSVCEYVCVCVCVSFSEFLYMFVLKSPNPIIISCNPPLITSSQASDAPFPQPHYLATATRWGRRCDKWSEEFTFRFRHVAWWWLLPQNGFHSSWLGKKMWHGKCGPFSSTSSLV